jgi:hypothetical protein
VCTWLSSSIACVTDFIHLSLACTPFYFFNCLLNEISKGSRHKISSCLQSSRFVYFILTCISPSSFFEQINYAFSANIAASGADVFKDGSKGLHMYSNCAANSYNDGPSSGGSDLQCEYYTGTGNAACSTTFPASLMDSACQTCANGTYGCCGRISSTCATTEPTCSADQDAVCP